MADLIELLRERAADHGGDKLLEEAAAALEAAREDACVALVADIRFACGDNGKRMQPELVEFIRGLAEDAGRYRFLRDSAACSLTISHNDHHNMYLSVADTLDDSQGYYNDISDSERSAMIATDTIWTLHVYPHTPGGFNVYHAATLDAAIDQARGKGGCREGVES